MNSTVRPDEPKQLRITCRAKSGDSAELEMCDLSEGGCMAIFGEWSAAPGERILARLPGQDWQSADVIWVEDGLVGLVFEKLLYEPTFLYLQKQMEKSALAELQA